MDKQFKQLMQRIHKSSNIMRFLKAPNNNNLNENLLTYNDTLDEV